MAKNNQETETNGINIIGVGTDINGDIVSNGDIRVDGGLNGKLSTKGKVVVGVTGKVKGEINCKNSDVEGYIEGKIIVVQLLSLKATAQINGDIVVSRLAIEPGCKFTGTCDMKGEIPSYEEKQKIGKQEKPPVKPE